MDVIKELNNGRLDVGGKSRKKTDEYNKLKKEYDILKQTIQVALIPTLLLLLTILLN